MRASSWDYPVPLCGAGGPTRAELLLERQQLYNTGARLRPAYQRDVI